MKKFYIFLLILVVVLTALVLAPLSGASRNERSKRREASKRFARGIQEQSPKPQSYQAVFFGESPTIRELAAAEAKQAASTSEKEPIDHEKYIEQQREKNSKGVQRERIEQEFSIRQQIEKNPKIGKGTSTPGEDQEKNPFNREVTRPFDYDLKTSPDAAIAKVPEKGSVNGIAPKVMPTPNVSFEGVSEPDTVALGQGFLPPDTNGDIGPNHYVQTVNIAFRIYNRTGTPLVALASLGSLWATIPGPCANTIDGDPIVLYDQLADRWLISQFCVSVANPNNHQLIAISQTGDPTGAYYLYDFMMPNNDFNDYPHFGMWPDAYYMTDNEFNQAGTSFLGAGVFAFNRAKMLAGDPTANFIYFDKNDGCAGSGTTCLFGGMLPADMDGYVPPAAGTPAPIAQFEADEFGNGQTDSIRILDFHADFAVPANSTLTNHAGSPVAVAAFDPREVPSGSRNVVPQPAPGVAVDVISDRLMFRLAYRNFGTHESLAMNHSVNAATNPSFRAGVRYYELRHATPAAGWAVQEQATMSGAGGDTENRWMGSTALNAAGSQAVAYSVSSSTVFPSIRYAGRLSGDPAGSLTQGETTMVAGGGVQTNSSGRWGDYSDLTVDPVDDCTFWYTQEYYAVTGSAPWHTRIGSFTFGPCPAVAKGILSGTVTSSAGGTPIANATIFANGYIRSSNGSGNYTVDPIGSGTYLVTASATGYVSKTINGVSITTGNTTTLNVQLDPMNILNPGTATITAESCAPANMAVDPGETVTVNLPIVNNGGAGATTTNLVGTLQATGGVSSPSGPQTYGTVAQGSPAVTMPFTFTVSTTCGQLLVATLHLQDGATDYGNITYNFQTGTFGSGSPLTKTTGNIATAIPDVSSVDIPIVVSQNGAVGDVNVKVRLDHTFDGDLTLALVAPDNTVVTLSAQRSSPNDGGDDYGTGNNDCSGTPTIFDDAAANSISTGIPPFAGTFRPETPLSAMNGKSINGTWKLRVTDSAAIDTGTVGCVTLDFQRRPYICCGVVGTPMIVSGGAATITAESISPANNAPDPGETVTANFPIQNTGDGNTANLVGTLQNSGGVTPVTTSATYGVVVAGGPVVSQPFTFVASGTCGNNITATIHFQDGVIDLGNITYTFRLGTTSVASTTFSNATAIVIPATGTGTTTGAPATPYPSNITVAGITAPVSKVTVTLKQISHTFPSDVDVLLVGPTGVKFVLMSDVIGGTDWTGQTYTFDDTAAALLPSSGTPPASGTFKPTNYGTGDAFPAPAPASPYLNPATAGTDTLAAFNNLGPNGTWSLYVVDDAGTDIGQFAGGWDLTITTTQSICNAQTCTITCPAEVTVQSATPTVVNYPPATPTGACGVLNYSTPSGSTFPVGTTVVTVTGANSAMCSFNVNVVPPNPPLIISEFRLRGPGGAQDEFVELYNNSNSPITVSTSDASAGWAVAASDGSVRFIVPNGTVIPARGHYLGVNSIGYSLGTYPGGNAPASGGDPTRAQGRPQSRDGSDSAEALGIPLNSETIIEVNGPTATGDATYTTDIPDNVGIALFNTATPANFTLANRLDAVGSTSEANTLFREGAGYAPLSGAAYTGGINYSFVRDMCGKGGSITTSSPCTQAGIPKDTNDNAADFIFVDTNGTSAGAGQRLGAPGPENLASPIQRNSVFSALLLDGAVSSGVAPNRFRNFTPGSGSTSPFGTLDIRRKFVNNTGGNVSRLRFRIIDITTFSAPAGFADLRPITSPDIMVATSGGTVLVRGTTLEQPPSQPNGGGFNSSMSAGTVTLGTPLANGASINVRLLLGVQQAGSFRFIVNIEALP